MKKILSVILICTLCALTLTSCIYTEKNYYERCIAQIETLLSVYDDFKLDYHRYEDVSGFDYISVYNFDKTELERVHSKAIASIVSIPYDQLRIDIEWKFTDEHIYYKVTCNRYMKEFEDIENISLEDAKLISAIIEISSDEFDSSEVINAYNKSYADLLKSDSINNDRVRKEFNTHFCHKCMMDEEYRDYHIHRRMEMDYKADKYYFKGYQYEDTMIFTDDISR